MSIDIYGRMLSCGGSGVDVDPRLAPFITSSDLELDVDRYPGVHGGLRWPRSRR